MRLEKDIYTYIYNFFLFEAFLVSEIYCLNYDPLFLIVRVGSQKILKCELLFGQFLQNRGAEGRKQVSVFCMQKEGQC